MAPKRPSPLEEPPASSSSEEEIESGEEEESDEEEQPEQKQPPPTSAADKNPSKKPETHQPQSSSSEEEETESGEEEESDEEEQPEQKQPPPTSAADKNPSKKPETHQPQSSSSEEEGSESESDSDHPPGGVADPNVKPIASKPMDDAVKLKKPRSKSTAAAASSTPTKSTAKRPKKKGGAEADGDEDKTAEKKPLFQRLWSEGDEIVMLKGLIDYKAKKGDPVADLYAFHEFVKKSLHVNVTRRQLLDKMRRLKKKFENNAKKGEDRSFSNLHAQKTYDLSKTIWGIEAIVNGGGVVDEVKSSRSNGKAKKKSDKKLTPAEKEHAPPPPPPKKDADADAEEQNVVASQVSILLNNKLVGGFVDESFMKEGLALLDSAKRSELERKWKKLKVSESEILLRRVELVRQQTKLVMGANKKR